ncbi:protein transport protein SFT2-like isoform X1 [Limulus polyphemus]|uniref:Vesicle transport protein n=1 Tax=Limulus polyphemus TaxID=6850 RepID=A0ABM1BRI3_LIMPO|nr:protein transport protein SFT2-like isoform X1 [Limulus polyphemus]
MVDLNQDLKNYLARPDTNRQNFVASIKYDTFKSWFSTKFNQETGVLIQETKNTNGWTSQVEKDPVFRILTRRQRIIGFVGCILMGFFCFTLAGFYAPFLLLKARKFALLYSLGSLFIICSFSLLWGPVSHAKHLCSKEMLPFTIIYFSSMFATLYFAMWVKSTIPTAVCAICQVLTLIWYVIRYIPGGQTGLRFFSKLFTTAVTRTVNKTLPV